MRERVRERGGSVREIDRSEVDADGEGEGGER